MKLSEELQQLTVFITPFGTYLRTFLPMGIKVGPQVFERMVQHVLRNCMPESGPYIDDVLSSTGKLPPWQREKGKLMDSDAYCDSDPQPPDSVQEWDACFEHHCQICFRMFKAFADAGLTVKPSECFLFMRQVKCVGPILHNEKRRPDPAKTHAVAK